MKRKILTILISMQIAICSVFTVAASTSGEKQISVTQSNGSKRGSTTLITVLNSVIEVDSGGTIVWKKTGLNDPMDAERLANGNTLIVEMGDDRVIEVDTDGNIVWNYSALNGPFDVERLENGNTLISEIYSNRVIEVDSDGTIVWEKAGLYWPFDSERLENGNTLIVEFSNSRVIEVDTGGTIVWERAGFNMPVDAERLANGNTLVTEYYYGNRIIEVDSDGNIVWVYNDYSVFFDAERFANGNTLITEFQYRNRVIEVDSDGTIVWKKTGLNQPIDAERISNPPTRPTIDGELSGKDGKEYEYRFNAVDPDGDDVRYFIDWGDSTSEWTDFNTSGTDSKVKHTWSKKGTYNIKAKAQDIYGFIGPGETLRVTMPRNKPFNLNFNLLEWFFERFPNAFLILRYILGFQ